MSNSYTTYGKTAALTIVDKAMCLKRSFFFYLLLFSSSATGSSRTYSAYVFKCPFSSDPVIFPEGQNPIPKGSLPVTIQNY